MHFSHPSSIINTYGKVAARKESTMTMNHHGIVHFEIPADDPEKLSQFYTQLFGWQIQKMDMGEMPYYVTMTVESDEQGMPKVPGAINGGIAPKMSPDQRTTNYVNVESVEQYVGKAKGLGAQVVMDKMPVPGMGWFAHLLDPEGNIFGVWQTDMRAK
jgi:predicted enzyme related to lactoylglutathione lyase